MSIATDLATFIQQVGEHVFIEAEGKQSTLNNFITTYNSSYSPRPRCLEGESKSLSTFSKGRTNGDFFTFRISQIDHQRTPFFPSIPFSPLRLLATE